MTINFSKNQKAAIEQATTLFNGSKGGVQVVCGYAGAGKTTILKEIVRSAGVAKVIAPTNRAVKVIEQKLALKKGNELCSTVHKFFNQQKIYDDDGADYGLSIIVDESSMLNNDFLNAFEYGVKKYGWKITLVGDGAQLPPIEKAGVQSRNFLARGYNTVELTEVFRQKDGDLLDFVTRVRLQRLTGVDKESAHVKVVNQAEAIEAFLADYQAGIPVMGLAWRNITRLKLNQILIQKLDIRKYNDTRFQYVAVNNTENFKNGETFFFEENTEVLAEKKITLMIKEVASPLKQTNTQSVPPRVIETNAVFLKYRDTKYILLPKCAEPTVTNYGIVGNTIPQELWADWTSEKVAANGKKYHNITQDVIVCEPGLVLTVHKAQGSQWQKVYVFENALNDTRWFYTACTRAEQEVIVVGNTAAKTSTATKSVQTTEERAICGSKNAPIGYYTGAKTAEELHGAKIVFYTSSFTQLKKLPEDKRSLAFAVSGGLPKEPELAWVRRISDINPAAKALIPSYSAIVKPYRNNPSKAAEEQYIQKFMKQLEKVSPLDVIEDGMILCCYETIEKFCHRHLIAKWAEDWGRAHGVKIIYGGEYFDNKRVTGKVEQQKQAAQPKEAKQKMSVDKRFAGIICQFTKEQIVQYADRVLEVAKTVKEKSDDGDSEFTDLVLSFTVEQIRGCADLIAQAAKQFVA